STYCGNGCSLTPATLPVDGVYTVLLLPYSDYTGSLTANFATGYVTGDVTIGGPPVTLTINSPGQYGTWRFTGRQGQSVSYAFTNGTFDYSVNASVGVRKPDGTTLITSTYCGSGCSLRSTALPVDGVYTIVLFNNYADTGSLTAKLTTP
ncbi:hypothetical protein, partial [Sphaerisporangium rufum]|uniref:hypothetical protein n=1 Tax=Sphaerisporangium rufum TaxID=1381558 RepID=UPI001950CADF